MGPLFFSHSAIQPFSHSAIQPFS
ncbi:hypothetical protein F941_00793, partial [Acinetobacter bouvetii DSM 14964 = CIP 107468]